MFPFNKKNTYSEAELLYKNWENIGAEKILSDLYNKFPSNLKIEQLYGNVLLRRGELKKAKKIFQSLLADNKINKTNIQLKLARINFYLNDLYSAKNNLQKVLSKEYSVKDSSVLAEVFNLLGLIEFNSMNYKKSLEYQKKSLKFAAAVHNLDREADALRQIGVLYWYASKHDSALNNFYKPALSMYRECKNKIGEATTLSDIGLIYKDKDMLENSLSYQLKAFSIRKQIGDGIGIADSYYFLGNLVSFSGWNNTLMYTYMKKSYLVSKRIGYKWGMEVASRALRYYFYTISDLPLKKYYPSDSSFFNVGEDKIYKLWDKIHRQKKNGKFYAESATLKKLIHLCDSLGYKNGEQTALGFLSSADIQFGKFNESRKILNRAYKINTKKHMESDFLLDTTAARLYTRLDELKKAKNILMSQVKYYDMKYLNIISGKNKKIIGNNISGIHQRRSAVYSMLEDVLYRLKDKSLFKFVQKRKQIPFWWRENINYNFSNTSGHNPFAKFVNLLNEYEQHPEKFNNIQPLVDLYDNSQESLNSINEVLFNDDAYGKYYQADSIKDIQKVLNKNEVLAEYFESDENLYVYVIKKDSSIILPLNITPNKIGSLVSLYNDVLERGEKNPDDHMWKGVSHHLYVILIQPLIEHGYLKENNRLIISPDKILNILSFQTLNRNKAGYAPDFCVEHYFISYVPSSSFLIKIRKMHKNYFNSLVSFAPGYGNYRGIKDEINNIPGKYFMNSVSLINNKATKDKLLKAFRNFDIVHIASHAKMNQWFPLYSYINCSGSKLRLYEVLNSTIKSKLVILSACETGLSVSSIGGFPNNEDILSFSRAFLAKGTYAVVASLWIVNDNSTARLMKLFYKNLFPENKNGNYLNAENIGNKISIVNALNNAQRQYINSRRENGLPVHPFYWGAFYVSGDGN